MEVLFVFALWIAIPLLILRYPLAGFIAAIALDGASRNIILIWDSGVFPLLRDTFLAKYQVLDKFYDFYFLFLAFLTIRHWEEALARKTARVLFGIRVVGIIIFEATGLRFILFFTPNIFEFFYLFYAAARKIRPGWQIQTKKRLFFIVLLLGLPKLLQEYILHIEEGRPWHQLKDQLFPWMP